MPHPTKRSARSIDERWREADSLRAPGWDVGFRLVSGSAYRPWTPTIKLRSFFAWETQARHESPSVDGRTTPHDLTRIGVEFDAQTSRRRAELARSPAR